MEKIFKSLIAALCLIFIISTPVKADNVFPFTDFIEKGTEYDNKTFTIEGEAIGEIMKRGDNCWININDGNMAIGIWCDFDLGTKVSTFGNYHNTGDTIKVTGEFHKACPEHGGDLDFHATSLEIVKSGTKTSHPISSARVILSCILLPISVVLFYCAKRR